MSSEGLPECVTLAFYGMSNCSSSLCQFWNLTDELLQAAGVDGSRVHCSAQSKGTLLFSRKALELSKAIEHQSGQPITSVQLKVESTDPTKRAAFSFNSGVSLHPNYLVVAISSELQELNCSCVQMVIEKICRMVSPSYGIGYYAPATNAAIYYALGMACAGSLPGTDSGWNEMERISRWGHTGMYNQVYRRGLLRDVYQWNVVSSIQCAMMVREKPLVAWIADDSSHGRLTSLTSELSLWEVDYDNLTVIRKDLDEQQLLFH